MKEACKNFKILTCNVRGLNAFHKRNSFLLWIKNQNPDIVFLQETFFTEKLKNEIKTMWKGEVKNAFSDSSHSKGVTLLFNENFEGKILNTVVGETGRTILTNFEFNSEYYSVVSVYAPNIENLRTTFLKNLCEFIRQNALNENNVVIAGDFNVCIRQIDRFPQKSVKDQTARCFTDLLKKCNLHDSWVEKYPEKTRFTYYDKTHRCYSRLDYILLSECLSKDIIEIYTTQPPRSNGVIDHKALILTFKIKCKVRGPGFWKLNKSVLHEQDYVNSIKDIIKDTALKLRGCHCSQLVWEMIKINIKEFSVSYSIRRANSLKKDFQNLQRELDSIIKTIEDNQLKGLNFIELECQRDSIQAKLARHYEITANGYNIRSRVKIMKDGIHSRYFRGLEQKRQSNNVIESLKVQNNLVSNDKLILDEISKFYTKLYSENRNCTNETKRYFENIDLPKLCSIDSKACNS